MTKFNGTVILKEEPWKVIRWMTMNYENEIGAVGIGKIVKGAVVVEKLLFPKQEVTGAHVHIDKEKGWGEIVKELSVEELGKIIFYWHKHPDGCAFSSQGDEDETYDVFMDEAAGRPMMAFLVTSNCDGVIKQDCRIELRKPIIGSLEATAIPESDLKIGKVCEKIIEKAVIKEKEKSTITTTFFRKHFKPFTGDVKELGEKVKGGKMKVIKFKCKNPLIEKLLDVRISNGMVTICCNETVEEQVDNFIDVIRDDILSDDRKKEYGSTGNKAFVYRLVPEKGKSDTLKEEIRELYNIIDQQLKLGEQQDDWKDNENSNEKALNRIIMGGDSYINGDYIN